MDKSKKSQFAVNIDHTHLPEPEWDFVAFEFGDTEQPTGMERLKLATQMD